MSESDVSTYKTRKYGVQVAPQGYPAVVCDPVAQRARSRPTGMIDQGARLAVGRGCDEVPDEAFDVLIPLVMVETVHEDGSADGFHVLLGELTFVASVGKDVCPPSPTAKQTSSMQMVPHFRSGPRLSVRSQSYEILGQN